MIEFQSHSNLKMPSFVIFSTGKEPGQTEHGQSCLSFQNSGKGRDRKAGIFHFDATLVIQGVPDNPGLYFLSPFPLEN